MSDLSKNQVYHLILADIAMVASVGANGGQLLAADREGYAPGTIRDHWMARTPESIGKRRMMAMVNAGIASLQQMTPERLIATAVRMDVPLDKQTAKTLVECFATRRDALLLYNH